MVRLEIPAPVNTLSTRRYAMHTSRVAIAVDWIDVPGIAVNTAF